PPEADLPADPEAVGEAAVETAPHLLLQRHRHGAALGELLVALRRTASSSPMSERVTLVPCTKPSGLMPSMTSETYRRMRSVTSRLPCMILSAPGSSTGTAPASPKVRNCGVAPRACP